MQQILSKYNTKKKLRPAAFVVYWLLLKTDLYQHMQVQSCNEVKADREERNKLPKQAVLTDWTSIITLLTHN